MPVWLWKILAYLGIAVTRYVIVQLTEEVIRELSKRETKNGSKLPKSRIERAVKTFVYSKDRIDIERLYYLITEGKIDKVVREIMEKSFL
jgi:hypothetical protein